jgi:nucleoside-diphosphate-sugar epimerase
VRPRLVWGPGDTTVLPQIVDAVRSGRFAWIGGGRHLTSTTHVDNAVEGLVLAARRGTPGGVFFVTDGAPVVFRDFVTRLLATRGVEAPARSVPAPVAGALAAAGEAAWRALPLPGRPPLTRLAVWLSSQEATIDISRARRELGYAPVIGVEEGLRALAGAA